MVKDFDENDAATWSPEFRDISTRAWLGLINGDLKSLEEYLRSDFPMTRSMREDIADCISGEDTLHRIVCKQRRSGPGGTIEAAVAYHDRIRSISQYVDNRVPQGSSGHLKRALHNAAQEFGLSVGAIKKARAEYRRRVKAGNAGGCYHLRGWANTNSPNRIWDVAVPVEVTNSDE